MVSVHDNIRKIRIAKNIKLKRVYECLGISRQAYDRFEKHGVGSDTEKVQAIADILEEDVSIFFKNELTEAVIEKEKRRVGEYARRRRSKGARGTIRLSC